MDATPSHIGAPVMAQAIDLDALGEALRLAELMIKNHSRVEDHERTNAALVAAGLPPKFDDFSLAWDRQQLATYQRQADALRAVITYFGANQAEAA